MDETNARIPQQASVGSDSNGEENSRGDCESPSFNLQAQIVPIRRTVMSKFEVMLCDFKVETSSGRPSDSLFSNCAGLVLLLRGRKSDCYVLEMGLWSI